MMKTTVLLSLLLSFVLCLPLSAQDKISNTSETTLAIPSKISYQGVLTDNSGNPLNGTFTMKFGLYTTPSGGSALWSETQSVVCSTGIFNVLLGAINPIAIAFDAPYYLDITVQDTVLSERIELASSGYSFNTARIQGKPVSASSPSSGQVLKWTGSEWAPGTVDPLGELEGEMGERVVFRKSELSVINEGGLPVSHSFLNLVATDGGVGIRFYKDFSFGNEMETNPWSIWIETLKGYQGLSIIRDWLFTAALWNEDGKLIVGRLDPHPPANAPASARFEVRGTIDEVQAMVKASENQTADIFQVVNGEGKNYLSVESDGNIVVGSPDDPKGIILYDSVDGSAYYLKVTNGSIELTPVE